MKFTYNWLKRYLDTNASPCEIADKLNVIGLEIENIVDKRSKLDGFIVAEIVEAKKHPNADSLKLLTVNTGKENLQIVCGAPNARAGIKGILALPGVIIPLNNEKLKISKIRGIESNGMMCAEDELCLSDLHDSIIELPDTIDVKVGDPAINALEKLYNIDTIFDGEVTSNRSDYLGVEGIAFDLSAAGVGKFIKHDVEIIKPEIENPISVVINDYSLSNTFTGIYIKNVRNCESPKWLKDLLISVGINPINAIVDISNFICLDMNRPLHMFDADKIIDNVLTIRNSVSGEVMDALNGKTYTLSDSDIVVSSGKDSKSIESIAGVIGGIKSSITDNTKNVFIESALFNNISIRKTATRLNIITDSKYRFERFVSSSTVLSGLYRATKLIKDICGGTVSDIVIAGDIQDNRKNIMYPISDFKKRIGMDLPIDRMERILTDLGFIVKVQGDNFDLTTPEHRGDINTKYDITEEMIRIYGYNNISIEPVQKFGLINQNVSDLQKGISLVKRSLCSNGMMEISSMMFCDSNKQSLFLQQDKGVVNIFNPISSDLNCMRASLLPNLLNAVSNNIVYGNNNLSLFECGYVFDGNNPGDEHLSVAGIRSGNTMFKHWSKRERQYDVFDVKKDLFTVLESLNFDTKKLTITSDSNLLPKYLNQFKSGIITYKKKIIGCFGEIHPLVLKEYEIKNSSVVCFEIDFSQLPGISYNKTTTKGKFIVNNFQQISRDLSFVFDKEIKSSEIINCIKKVNNDLIKNVYIFDVYENSDSLGVDKKSIAITLNLQPIDKTLTDNEINQIMQNTIDEVKKTLNGILLKDFCKS